jgi:hypothetical protein
MRKVFSRRSYLLTGPNKPQRDLLSLLGLPNPPQASLTISHNTSECDSQSDGFSRPYLPISAAVVHIALGRSGTSEKDVRSSFTHSASWQVHQNHLGTGNESNNGIHDFQIMSSLGNHNKRCCLRAVLCGCLYFLIVCPKGNENRNRKR